MKPSQAFELMKFYRRIGQPVMLHGSPGIGKSQVAKQLAEANDERLIDMRLSQLDAVDLSGVPYREEGMTYFAVNARLPTDIEEHGERGILFLDEITHASSATRKAAFQIVLDHAIGGTPLLPGWWVLAAGNRAHDYSGADNLEAALKNRFAHIHFEVDNDDWIKWAIINNIALEVLGFIRFRPTLLNEFDRLTGENDKAKKTRMTDVNAFATPRTWSFIDRAIKAGIPAGVEYDTYAGLVGEGVAAEFTAYIKHQRSLPNLDLILTKPDTVPVPTEPAVLYALCTGLAAKATEKNFANVVKYLFRLDPEFQALTVKDVAMRNNEICNTAAFRDWAAKNADFLA